ncbi:MAG: polysaccharide deacetylase family protein [Chthoniobacterales bacterium]
MELPNRNNNPLRTALLGFAVLAPVCAIVLAFLRAPVLAALAPIFFAHLLLLYATLTPNCQWLGPVCTHFETDSEEVWLTIDDGPSPLHTLPMLELLKQYDARATFFVIGAKAEKYPHLLTEILAQGHALANHTQTHPVGSFWCASAARVRREIDACAGTLRTTERRPANFFRAPAGMQNLFVAPILKTRGLSLVGWTVRGLDTVKRDAARVAQRIENAAVPGAIIVLHEGHQTKRDPEFGPRCLELTLQRLTARGYRCVIPRPEQLRSL